MCVCVHMHACVYACVIQNGEGDVTSLDKDGPFL